MPHGNSHLFSPQVAQIGSVAQGGEKGARHQILSYRILLPFICGNQSDVNLISANACVVQADRLDVPWRWESDVTESATMGRLCWHNMLINTSMMLMGSLLSLSLWKCVNCTPKKAIIVFCFSLVYIVYLYLFQTMDIQKDAFHRIHSEAWKGDREQPIGLSDPNPCFTHCHLVFEKKNYLPHCSVIQ